MRTIRHVLDERAETQPDRVYMIAPEPGLGVTYGRLREDAVRLGKYFMKCGLRKGIRGMGGMNPTSMSCQTTLMRIVILPWAPPTSGHCSARFIRKDRNKVTVHGFRGSGFKG